MSRPIIALTCSIRQHAEGYADAVEALQVVKAKLAALNGDK